MRWIETPTLHITPTYNAISYMCIYIYCTIYTYILFATRWSIRTHTFGNGWWRGLQSCWSELLRGSTTERRSVTEQNTCYMKLNVYSKMIEMWNAFLHIPINMNLYLKINYSGYISTQKNICRYVICTIGLLLFSRRTSLYILSSIKCTLLKPQLGKLNLSEKFGK